MRFEAHDLVRLRALPLTADAPAWLLDAFALAPFAVVRRAPAPEGVVPVGFRGATRSQRYGTFIARDFILSTYAPEQLVERKPCPERARLKTFVALRELAVSPMFDTLVWGPTGSVGFELATTQPTVTEASDLDLLIRTPSRLDRGDALGLRERLAQLEYDLGLRIDAQLETPAGGIALAEWAQGKPRVMVRSANGPRLIENPWHIDCPLLPEVDA